MKAAVIGAGVGGLGIANLLAKTGWEVDVFEKNGQAGGRLGRFTDGGFVFDTGPSWYLMPEVYEQYFGLLGESVRDHLQLKRLEPSYRVWAGGGEPVEIFGDEEVDRALFERLEPGSGKMLGRYLDRAERNYNLAAKHFLHNSHSVQRSLSRPAVWPHMPHLAAQLAQPLHRHVKRFVKAQPLQQILEYPMVFLGASPYNAPALYHLMNNIDFRQGAYYPMGGMYEIAVALERIGRGLGVQYHYHSPVTEITLSAGRATGVVTGGVVTEADVVISDADLHFTENRLLPPEARTYPERYWKRQVAGPSALVMYLGVRGELPQLAHHNLLLRREWRENFVDIFDRKVWPGHPSQYVSKTTATDSGVAPAGHENVVVLVPLPASPEANRQARREELAERYLDEFARVAGIPDLRGRIVVRQTFWPSDYSDTFNSWSDMALGTAHVLRQSAFFRPGPRSRKVKNLLYVGGGVQPGIGVPMCLISAEVAYKALAGDRSHGPLTELAAAQGGWRV